MHCKMATRMSHSERECALAIDLNHSGMRVGQENRGRNKNLWLLGQAVLA